MLVMLTLVHNNLLSILYTALSMRNKLLALKRLISGPKQIEEVALD